MSSPSETESSSRESRSKAPFDAADAAQGASLVGLIALLNRGRNQIIALAALGIAIAGAVSLASPPSTSTTVMKVAFAFPGNGRGEYPDHSKFQPDDIRSATVIRDALKRQKLDPSEDFQRQIGAALTVEGIIPREVTNERDRLRGAGQPLAPFFPDEYQLTLTLPLTFPLTARQRELLLEEIVGVYSQQFQRTYAEVPLAFGNAFDSLRTADYYEYELILGEEMRNITAYLNQQLDQAKTFRSPSTNLSFGDLLNQTEIFAQVRLNETLGLIRQNGLTRSRSAALVKIDYYLRTLEDQEHEAIEQERVVDELLAKVQNRSQNNVLGSKSQATQPHSETPILDQGLIDSLLANDGYNFLIRRALDAGLAVKQIQSEEARLLERRKDLIASDEAGTAMHAAMVTEIQKSLGDLELSYRDLISNIRKTYADFARQQFANAIRVSMPPITLSLYRPAAISCALGAFIGLAMGAGLSLLGIAVGAGMRRSTERSASVRAGSRSPIPDGESA